jgi:hypothetical protein
MHYLFHCGLHCAVHGKRLKKKEKKNKTKAYATDFFFLHKKYQKKLRSKSVLSFYKNILKSLWSSYNAWPRVIFKILIIILNLHDSSLSESGCNTGPKSLGYGSGCKVVL